MKKKAKVTNEEMHMMKTYEREARALTSALGRVQEDKDSWWDYIRKKYKMDGAEKLSLDHRTRRVTVIK